MTAAFCVCRKLRYYMRYIPPGVTDIQLYGVCKATVHDPDPGYYRYCFKLNTHKYNFQLS